MNSRTLVETPHFSQIEFALSKGESAEQGILAIDQTFLILNGVGIIRTPNKIHQIHCRSFVHVPSNTPVKISNTGDTLLTIVLTQGV